MGQKVLVGQGPLRWSSLSHPSPSVLRQAVNHSCLVRVLVDISTFLLVAIFCLACPSVGELECEYQVLLKSAVYKAGWCDLHLMGMGGDLC